MSQPVNRPRGVVDDLHWDVSHALEQQHRRQFTEAGELACCDQAFPCPSAQLAARGLLAAQRLYPPTTPTRKRLMVWRRWRLALVVRRSRDMQHLDT